MDTHTIALVENAMVDVRVRITSWMQQDEEPNMMRSTYIPQFFISLRRDGLLGDATMTYCQDVYESSDLPDIVNRYEAERG